MTTLAGRPDSDELARFRSRPGDPAAVIRFALHLQGRDPTNVWAPMTLAEYASEPEEHQAMLWQAVRAGKRRWEPESRAREVAWWDEKATRPFLAAIYAYGLQSAALGFIDEAARCVRAHASPHFASMTSLGNGMADGVGSSQRF